MVSAFHLAYSVHFEAFIEVFIPLFGIVSWIYSTLDTYMHLSGAALRNSDFTLDIWIPMRPESRLSLRNAILHFDNSFD